MLKLVDTSLVSTVVVIFFGSVVENNKLLHYIFIQQ